MSKGGWEKDLGRARARKGKGGEWATVRPADLDSFAYKDMGVYIQKGQHLRMIIRGRIVLGLTQAAYEAVRY